MARASSHGRMQLSELENTRTESLRKIDDLERASTATTKETQQYEAQIQSLQRQMREAQAALRVAEKDLDRVRP
jgi:flagellar biosynthesis chaperone FliJ